MAAAFLKSEYDDRLARVRTEMAARGLDALVIGDPDNINWLTGYDAWSFYTPQMMLVDLHDGPFWMGRLMDAGAANFTTYLTALSGPILSRSRPHMTRRAILRCWRQTFCMKCCVFFRGSHTGTNKAGVMPWHRRS